MNNKAVYIVGGILLSLTTIIGISSVVGWHKAYKRRQEFNKTVAEANIEKTHCEELEKEIENYKILREDLKEQKLKLSSDIESKEREKGNLERIDLSYRVRVRRQEVENLEKVRDALAKEIDDYRDRIAKFGASIPSLINVRENLNDLGD